MEKEQLIDNLTSEQEEKLQDYFINEVREIGGRGITKDNCEDMFESWLEDLTLSELQNLLK